MVLCCVSCLPRARRERQVSRAAEPNRAPMVSNVLSVLTWFYFNTPTSTECNTGRERTGYADLSRSWCARPASLCNRTRGMADSSQRVTPTSPLSRSRKETNWRAKSYLQIKNGCFDCCGDRFIYYIRTYDSPQGISCWRTCIIINTWFSYAF